MPNDLSGAIYQNDALNYQQLSELMAKENQQLRESVTDYASKQREILQRPGIMYQTIATVSGVVLSAYYNGITQMPDLALKALYAIASQIIAVNVGLAIGNEYADNIVFGLAYYGMTSLSSQMNINRIQAEALVGTVAGLTATAINSNRDYLTSYVPDVGFGCECD